MGLTARSFGFVCINPYKPKGFSLNQRCTIKYELETLYYVGIQEKVSRELVLRLHPCGWNMDLSLVSTKSFYKHSSLENNKLHTMYQSA